MGCAREAAQDQHAVKIVARSHEFLRHQIHAVVQRRHQAEIGGAVIRQNLLVAVLAVQEHDGLPVAGLEAAVDAFGFLEHFLHQILIAPDVRAAGRADLHERELAPVGGILFEKALDGAEALRNALGVIDAIDADAQKRSAHAELVEQADALHVREFERRRRLLGSSGDADRERADQRIAARCD